MKRDLFVVFEYFEPIADFLPLAGFRSRFIADDFAKAHPTKITLIRRMTITEGRDLLVAIDTKVMDWLAGWVRFLEQEDVR